MKKKTSLKKYGSGGSTPPEYTISPAPSAGSLKRKEKTKVYSDNDNYVKKTVTRKRLLAPGIINKEKTRRTVKGFLAGAPSASKMSQFESEYKNLETQKRGGSVKSKKK